MVYYLPQFITSLEISIKFIEKTKSYDVFFLLLLVISLSIIALIKTFNQTVIINLLKSIFSFNVTTNFSYANLKYSPTSSILLILNFIFSFTLCVKLAGWNQNLPFNAWLISIGFSLMFIFSRMIGLFFVSILTNESKTMQIPIVQFLIGIETAGILLSILAVFWNFNLQWNRYFLNAFIGIILFFFLLRIIKGTLSILHQGVSWYYIIIYLCTLEILPIMITYYYFIKDFYVF